MGWIKRLWTRRKRRWDRETRRQCAEVAYSLRSSRERSAFWAEETRKAIEVRDRYLQGV